ncbi:MAG: sulfatase [Ruthenibacterium sp.]
MKQKNLLYIFADQWRYHAAGFAHQDPVATPNMDAFAAHGMQFTNAVSTYPLCSPHRASLLTGKYPTHCGMWTNCKPGLSEVVMLKPQETCISDVLHENGYRTAYIGKWHLDASETNFTAEPMSGAVHWDAYTPQGERRHHFDFWHSYGAMDVHTDPHYWENSPEKIKPGKWSPTHETDVALDYLDKNTADKPFCLFLSWNPPHPPYDLLPAEYDALYRDKAMPYRENVPQNMREDATFNRNRERYFAAVAGLDVEFGRLTDYLTAHDLWNDTIVVLSADHGDCMGSHGLYGKNVWYEESIRIPLVIGGAQIAAGTSDCLLASPDHAPTLLGLLGAEIPACMEGKDLSAAVLQHKIMHEPQAAFLCMIPGMPDMVHAYAALGLDNHCFGWRGIRTKTHTYLVDNGTVPNAVQTRYLYDNIADPYQMQPQLLQEGDALDAVYAPQLAAFLTQLHDDFLLHLPQKGNDK